jgi:predicted N-acetyltransferase YhbS
MITIRLERSTDIAVREDILDNAYGDVRFTKPSARLREGRLPADGLALVAVERGRVVGTVRLWNVRTASGWDALLLGPLAVSCESQGLGVGAKLMRRALKEARRLGHRAVLLVGDAAYYGRFGFSAKKTGSLRVPGPFAPERLLGIELIAGSLNGASGMLRASGDKIPADLPDFIVAPAYARRAVPALARAA